MTFVNRKEWYVINIRKTDLFSMISSSNIDIGELELQHTVAATSLSIPGTTTTEKFDSVFAAHLAVSLI